MSNNELMNHTIKYEVNGEQINLSGNTVKQYLVSGNGNVTDQEVVMFLNLCKFQQLNPFLNEAYLIKFGSQPAQIIVSKEAFMKRAEMNPHYRGVEAGIIVERNNELKEVEGAVKLPSDKLIGAYANVYRDDRDKPVTVRISLEEFGKGQATWKQMPMNMIRKTAIVNALREAFPNNVGAMYTEDDVQPQTEREAVVNEVQSNQATETLDFNQQEEVPQFNEIKQEEKELEPATKEKIQPKQEEQQFDFDDDEEVPF